MKKTIWLYLLIVGFLFAGAESAQAYNINGNLNDWGVTKLGRPGQEDWIPNAGIYYTVEDYVGPGGYVGPGWGGQTFDAEAMYLDWDSTNLYLALVTGFPRDGGVYVSDGDYWVSAGDIGIDFGADGTYEYGIEIRGHGDVYGGYKGKRGHVYTNITWDTSSTFPESNPLNIANTGSPEDRGKSKFKYKRYNKGKADYERWVLEMSVPRSYFGSDWNDIMTVHWTQTCGNDNINVTTPEPMSMVLFGSGLLGVFFRARKRKKA